MEPKNEFEKINTNINETVENVFFIFTPLKILLAEIIYFIIIVLLSLNLLKYFNFDFFEYKILIISIGLFIIFIGNAIQSFKKSNQQKKENKKNLDNTNTK